MASNKLFSYNIEENDGKLVITIDGLYAQTAIQHLRTEVESGRGWRALSGMSPLRPLNRLSRQAARALELGNEIEAEKPVADPNAPLDLETIFNQGFAETYDDFGKHLERFATTLGQLKSEFESNQTKTAQAAPAPVADKKTPAK